MNPLTDSEGRRALHAELRKLDKEYESLQKKAMEAEEHVLAATATELRELHSRLKRTNRSLSKLFTGPG